MADNDRSPYSGPIKLFVGVTSGETTDALNQLINDINSTFQSVLTGVGSRAPRIRAVCGAGNYMSPNGAPQQTNGTTQLSGSNRFTFTPVVDCKNIQMLFMNSVSGNGGAQSAKNGNAFSLVCSIEDPNNGLRPLSFPQASTSPISTGGWTSVPMADFSYYLTSPYAFELPAGMQVVLRVYWSVSAGQKVPTNWRIQGYHRDSTIVATTDIVNGTTTKDGSDTTFTFFAPEAAPVATNVALYGPSLIVGEHISVSPAVMVEGDSIAVGTAGSLNDTQFGQGFITRALDAAGGFIVWNVGQSGIALSNIISTGLFTAAVAKYFDHVVLQAGTNDLALGATAVAMMPQMLAYVRGRAGPTTKVWVCTIPPRTTSTNNFATISAQTVLSSEPQRIAFNNWLRDPGANGFGQQAQAQLPWADRVGVIDSAGQVEYSANGQSVKFSYDGQGQQPLGTGGYWISDGVAFDYTGDGTHPKWSEANAQGLMGAAIPISKFIALY